MTSREANPGVAPYIMGGARKPAAQSQRARFLVSTGDPPNEFGECEAQLSTEGARRWRRFMQQHYVPDVIAQVNEYDVLREQFAQAPDGFSLFGGDGDSLSIPARALAEPLRGLFVFDEDAGCFYARPRDTLGIAFGPAQQSARVDIFDEIIPQSSVVVFVGKSGALKSWLCVALAADFANDRPWLGRFACFGQREDRSARVLYVNADAPPGTLKARLHGCNDPHGLVGTLHYPTPNPDQPAFWDELKRSVRPKLVIVDTLTGAVPGVSERDTLVALPLKLARRYAHECEATVVFTHHEGHEQKKGLGVLRGSSAIGADVDMVFHLVAEKSAGPLERRSRVTAIKHRDFAVAPPSFTLQVLDGKVGILGETQNDVEAVLAAIKASPGMSRVGVAAAIGMPRPRVNDAVTALVEAGRVRVEGKGKTTKLFERRADQNGDQNPDQQIASREEGPPPQVR